MPAESPAPTTRAITATIAVLAFSAFVMILNETVLSVALPPLMAEFGVSANVAQWLTTGFLLTMAVVIPTTGFLLRRFSLRALFGAALVLFVLGTLIASLAPSFPVMLAARVVQACGTAIIMPLLMTTTLSLVAPQRRGSVMGLNSIVIAVAPAIGPTLSGVIIEALGWRWVFGLMIPVAAIALGVGLVFLPRIGGGERVPLDIRSVVLSLLGFGGLVAALSTAADIAEGAWSPVLSLVIGVAALALFARRQLGLQRDGDRALLDLRPFAERNFTLGVVLIMIAFGVLLGTVVVLPIAAQSGLGMSVLATGLMLLPGGVTQGVLAPIVGRLTDLIGARVIVIPGLLLMSGAQWWLSALTQATSLGELIAMHVMFSAGMALVLTPMMTHSMSALPAPLFGHGSAILNTLQQLAGAAGTAALVGALAVGSAAAPVAGAGAVIAGARLAFQLGGCLTLAGAICALFLTRLARR